VQRADPAALEAVPIGTVLATETAGRMELETTLGVLRAPDLPAGEQLPRIC